jgi:hypothetical protein
MEEYHNFGCGDEFDHELREDDWGGFSSFVEVDTEAFDTAEIASSKFVDEFELAV